MAKGDKKKSENMIQTQGKTAQNYLTGVQSGLGTQANNYNNMMWGSPQSYDYSGVGKTPPSGANYTGGTAVPRTGFPAGTGYTGVQGPTGPTTNWDEATFSNTFGRPGTPNDLIALEGKLNEQGIKVLRNAEGTAGKIQLPNGQIVDVIRSAGLGGGPENFQWLTGGGGGSVGFGGGVMNQAMGDYSNLMSQYQNWADTGGFTPEQLQNIRSRSNSPVRAAYSNAQREMERGRALQGGYSPGFNAATARMAREQGQLASDQSTNTEAMIAELLNRGKQFGMSGMSGMYGTTPGLASTFGNQMLAAQGQRLQAAGLQNQLGLGMMNAQNQAANVPGNWQQAMNNIGSMGSAIGEWTGAIYPWTQ